MFKKKENCNNVVMKTSLITFSILVLLYFIIALPYCYKNTRFFWNGSLMCLLKSYFIASLQEKIICKGALFQIW